MIISKIKDKLSNINIKNNKCSICINSKMKNKPYKLSTNKTNQIFDLIHLDLVGPITPSINNNKYFLSILVDFSRFAWVIFSENKTDIFNKFIVWHINIYNTFNINVKSIKSDNGKEFSNTNFQTFCQENGIIHNFTVPYNPSQNGKIERLNGILISSAKALLNEAKLSRHFWEYEVDTANFIHNRLPHQGNENKIFKIFLTRYFTKNPLIIIYFVFLDAVCTFMFQKNFDRNSTTTPILVSLLVTAIILMHIKFSI